MKPHPERSEGSNRPTLSVHFETRGRSGILGRSLVFGRNIFRRSDFVGRSDTEEKIVGEEVTVKIALTADFQIHFRPPR